MNGDCKLLHGSVLLDSIFVNKAGDWKLGAFDLVCSIAEEESLFKVSKLTTKITPYRSCRNIMASYLKSINHPK